jgi:hypothetical protein
MYGKVIGAVSKNLLVEAKQAEKKMSDVNWNKSKITSVSFRFEVKQKIGSKRKQKKIDSFVSLSLKQTNGKRHLLTCLSSIINLCGSLTGPCT